MNIKFLAAAALVCACPVRALAVNAFMGHYGYMLTYPVTYSANPTFKGAIEVVDIFPEKCAGLKKRSDCAKLGMIELYALPKGLVEASINAKTLDSYVAAIRKDAKKEGIKSRESRKKRAGFPSALIEMLDHPEPLNTMIVVEGSKVYYRFKFNAKTGAKAAAAIVETLKEVAPHDNPPK